MQYLYQTVILMNNLQEGQKGHLPNGMNPFVQVRCGCPVQHKVFHLVEFFRTSSFKSTGIMKNEAWVAAEYQLILNAMLSPLGNVSTYGKW